MYHHFNNNDDMFNSSDYGETGIGLKMKFLVILLDYPEDLAGLQQYLLTRQ